MNIYQESADQICTQLGMRTFSELGITLDPNDKSQLDGEHTFGWGGDTTSGTKWITNGPEEQLIKAWMDIPEGWRKGRSSKAVFNNSKMQSEFGKKNNDFETRSKASMEAWATGKMEHRNHGGKLAKSA